MLFGRRPSRVELQVLASSLNHKLENNNKNLSKRTIFYFISNFFPFHIVINYLLFIGYYHLIQNPKIQIRWLC